MKIINLAIYDFKKLMRDKTALLAMLLLPIVFTFIFSLVYSDQNTTPGEPPKIPVGIANSSNSEIAVSIINQLNEDDTLDIIELDEEEIRQRVRSSVIEVGFIIPENFGTKEGEGINTQINVVSIPSSSSSALMESKINSIYTKLRVKLGTLEYYEDKLNELNIVESNEIQESLGNRIDESNDNEAIVSVERNIFQVEQTNDNTALYSGRTYSTIGIIVMFVMFIVIIGGMGTILEEKKNYSWDRLKSSPISMLEIMLGKVLGTFIKGWVQILIIILFSKYVMSVQWGGSIASLIVIFSVYLLSITGLGMFLANLVQTNTQLGALASIIIIPTSMLSGAYWPIELTPEAMQKIAMIFPQYWAIKALRSIVIGGTSLSENILPIMVLIGMGVFYSILSSFSGKTRTRTLKKPSKISKNTTLSN